MRRRLKASFEDPTSPGGIGPWEDFLGGTSPYRQSSDSVPDVKPFPVGFCLMIMVLSSLLMYGAAYGLLAFLN